jgi:uncharacterized protein (DUF885 family)
MPQSPVLYRALLALACLLASLCAFGQQPTAKQQCDQLLKDYWEEHLRASPETATYLGDHRYDAEVSDLSAEATKARREAARGFLARARAIDATKLTGQDALNLKLITRRIAQQIEHSEFEPWLMPVSQFDGPHMEYAELSRSTAFRNVADYDNYIARLKKLPRLFDQLTANMREGMRKGLMPPAYLLPEVARQAETIASGKGDANAFAVPLKKFPDAVADGDRERIRKELNSVIDTELIPTYKKFAAFVRDEYAPHGRKEPGIWAVPKGNERYLFAIREMTTTNMTAEEIHQVGLKEVARIEREMLVIAKQKGFNDLDSFHAAIRKNRDLYGTSGEQILGLYKSHLDEIEKDLPKYFGHLPKAKLEVIPMSAYRAGASVPADYSPGTPDGSRAGHVNVNMTAPEKRLLLNLESIAYHEGLPGHHLQISLAQEMGELPQFRRQAGYTAYVEGWALYTEQLAHEMGYNKDPYSEYGRLENDMWRAIRLVVDTGVHSQHWTRDQMVEYFRKYTAMDEPNIQTEVDRYIAWPGQALAYKVGQMTILRLREKAKKELGAKFDIRAFHDELLGAGALPMDVIEERMNAWIARQAGK